MGKKAVMILCVVMSAVFLICVNIMGNTDVITQDDISNISNEETKRKIANIMLKDTGREGEMSPDEIVDIAVLYGDITGSGNREDVIIDAYFGPRYTLIGAYKGNNDGKYTYLDNMGVFYDSNNPRTVYMQNEKKDAVFINERFNDKIGAFINNLLN